MAQLAQSTSRRVVPTRRSCRAVDWGFTMAARRRMITKWQCRCSIGLWIVTSSVACENRSTLPAGSTDQGGSAAGTAPGSTVSTSGSGGSPSSHAGSGGVGGTALGGWPTYGASSPMCSGGGCIHTFGTVGQVDGSGFEADGGKVAHGVVRSPLLEGSTELSDPVAQGRFSFSWDTVPRPGRGGCPVCSVVGNDSALVLIFIDRNGSGSCESDSDPWWVRAGFMSLEVALTPLAEPCPAGVGPEVLAKLADACVGLPTSCTGDAAGGAGGDGAGGAGGDGAGGAP